MAEGVGIPTFQFKPVLQQVAEGANTSAPRLGVSGGQSRSGVATYTDFGQTAGPGLDAQIPGFISEAFAPKIAAQKQAQFWKGFVDARAGKTIQEISADEPWYARTFGPTPYAQGADMFAVQKAASDMESQFIAEMPELRKLTTEEVGQRLNEMAQTMQTGDLYADALITRNFMDRAGTMMDAHTKSRYAWQQEELSKGQYEAWMSAGRAFHGSSVELARMGREHPGQEPDATMLREQGRVFLQTLQSSPTLQNPESYAQTLQSTVESLADEGQWYAVRAIQSTGILKMLPTEDQDRLQARLETSRNKVKQRVATNPDMIRAVTQVTSAAKAGALSAEETVDRLEGINSLYASLTGDDRGYFELDDYVRHAGNASDALYRAWEKQFDVNARAKEKADTEAAKQAAEARNDALLTAAVGSNSVGTVSKLKGVTVDDASRSFNAALEAAPEQAGVMIVGNYAARDPYVDDRLKARLQSRVKLSAGEELTDGFMQAYNQFISIRDTKLTVNGKTDGASGVGAASAYYGDLFEPMQQFDDAVRAGMPAEAAYRRVFGNEVSFGGGDTRGRTGKESKEIQAEFDTAVAALNPKWYEFGRTKMGSSATNLVAQASSRYYEVIRRNSPEMSVDAAVAEAVHAARANGLEIAGRYAWQNMRGQPTVAQTLGMDSSVFEDYFDETLTNKMRKQGMSMDGDTSLTIIRVGDDSRGARLMATAFKDGKYTTVFMSGDDFKALRNKKAEDDIKRARDGGFTGMFDAQSILPQPKF